MSSQTDGHITLNVLKRLAKRRKGDLRTYYAVGKKMSTQRFSSGKVSSVVTLHRVLTPGTGHGLSYVSSSLSDSLVVNVKSFRGERLLPVSWLLRRCFSTFHSAAVASKLVYLTHC